MSGSALLASKNAVYDALFARGMTMHRDLLRAVTTVASPGWPEVVAAVRATVEFTDQNPTLARLMFERTVPGFTPSAEAYAPSVEAMQILHDAVASAVNTGDLAPGAATDAGMELLLTLVAGVISNRSSNQPQRGEPRVLPVVLDMYRDRYRPAPDQQRPD